MEVKVSLLQQAVIALAEDDHSAEKDLSMREAGKLAARIMNAEIKKAGLKAGYPQKEATFKKAAIALDLGASGGTLFNHYVPLKARYDGRTAPHYVGFSVSVDSSGETFRHTSDGPVDNSKNYFSWSHEWKDEVPTEEELKAQIPAIRDALAKALKKFDEVEADLRQKDK